MNKENNQKQTKLVFDFYKDNLEDVIDSNIDDRLFSRNNYLQLLKPSTSVFPLEKAVLLLSEFPSNNSRVINSKQNNSKLLLTNNLSLRLLLNIVF